MDLVVFAKIVSFLGAQDNGYDSNILLLRHTQLVEQGNDERVGVKQVKKKKNKH